MSPKRLPGSPTFWVILVILWVAIATAPAKAEPGRHAVQPAHGVPHSSSLSTLRHSIASLAHRFHYRHRVTVVPPGSAAFAAPAHLRPADGDQAIQTGSLLPWFERTDAEPPVPVVLLAQSNRPPAECGEYSERRTPRGPPGSL